MLQCPTPYKSRTWAPNPCPWATGCWEYLEKLWAPGKDGAFGGHDGCRGQRTGGTPFFRQ